MKKNICKICSNKTKSKKVTTRSKKKTKIFICKICDFEFFSYDPRKNLERNKLDVSRLKKAGLKIPSIKENFNRTLSQSKSYLKTYIKNEDKNKKILEIGCAHGSFLHLVKKKRCKVYGVEINDTLRHHLNQNLKIKCFKTLDEAFKKKIKFKKIFLFYCLEYFLNFKKDLMTIISMLESKGEVIIITPNKNDILNSLYPNEGYSKFFYDINSINYFSLKSLKNLMKKTKISKYKIFLKQGYSLGNFYNWVINSKPLKTGLVGEDDLIYQISNNFKRSKLKSNKKIINKLKILFFNIEKKYKKYLETQCFCNQIILKIKK